MTLIGIVVAVTVGGATWVVLRPYERAGDFRTVRRTMGGAVVMILTALASAWILRASGHEPAATSAVPFLVVNAGAGMGVASLLHLYEFGPYGWPRLRPGADPRGPG